MVRSIKFIIVVLLVLLVSASSYAAKREVNIQQDNFHLTLPKLHIPLKSIPKLVYPSLNSELLTEADSSDSYSITKSEQDKYTLLTKPLSLSAKPYYSVVIKNPEVQSLYKEYGFNDAVENSLYFFSTSIKERFTRYLNRAGKYLSQITEVLKEKELPMELAFLPLIESGFNAHASSPAKAVGLWQFISSTAKRYGLKIDGWVDERKDPIKATRAAAEYLSDLYNMFGSWNLALAAYNAGEYRVLKALKKADTDDFWALRETKHIPKETKNYVPSYIAATAIALDPEDFGFEKVSYNTPLEYDEIEITSPMHLKTVAKFTGVEVSDIKELNPELRRSCTPPGVSQYTLRIPRGTKEDFLYHLQNAEKEDLLNAQSYTVKKGDTIKKISKQFGIPSQIIIELNSLNKNAPLTAGSKILIPVEMAGEFKADSIKGKIKKTSRSKNYTYKHRRSKKAEKGSLHAKLIRQ